MSVVLYGIKNCDTVKKARRWLDAHEIPHSFHDYKTAGIDAARLKEWCDAVGWETLLNRAGTTFRKLPADDKQGIDERKALRLMLANPSMIKRPVVERSEGLLVGFEPATYERLFGRRPV
jgi:arsenate reductase